MNRINGIKYFDYEQLYLTRKKRFYKGYFEDQRKAYVLNILKVSAMGYVGGCFFGLIMLAFSMLGTTRFEQSVSSLKYEESLYKGMKEFRVAMKEVSCIY